MENLKAVIYRTKKDSDERLSKIGEKEFEIPEKIATSRLVTVFPDIEYQTVIGFGGAFTEAASVTYDCLCKEEKEKVIKAYFDKEDGIGYNFCRTHIHSCDFTPEPYTYVKEGDETLESFDMSHDEKSLIPMIKDAQKHYDFKLFASPWTPPAFMKEEKTLNFGPSLLPKYYDLWAEYIKKYILKMKDYGIDIWGITVQNEPRARQKWESCYYSPEQERDFVKNSLGKALEGLGVKIFIYDHNKDGIIERAEDILSDKDAEKYIDGIAFHWYTGDHFENIELFSKMYPDKMIFCSEICKASEEKGVKVKDGWDFAESYGHEIIGDFNSGCSAFCDWNMILDENNGPYHWRPEVRSCDAPVIINTKTKEVTYEPSYYYIGHFSKFVKSGAKRLAISKWHPLIEACAFKNPDGSIAVIIMNRGDEDFIGNLRINRQNIEYDCDRHSILTFVIK